MRLRTPLPPHRFPRTESELPVNLNLLELVPAELTPERVEPLILANSDRGLVSAASSAAGAMQTLFARLTAADLLRLVAGRPDAAQCLAELGATARQALTAILVERAESAAKMQVDQQTRQCHDGAVVQLLGEAEAAVQHSTAQAASAESETLKFRMSLIGAGLSAAEIDVIVAKRVAEGQPEAEAHRAAAIAAQARVDVLTAFITDPLRRVDSLEAELLNDVHVRMDLPRLVASQAAAATLVQALVSSKKLAAPASAGQVASAPVAVGAST